jgi:hypothetical protein
MNVDVRDHNQGWYEDFSSYSWEDPIYVYFIGSGESMYLEVESWNGKGDFTLTISELEDPLHATEDDAQEAVLGTNSGELFGAGIPYFFRFVGDYDKWYKFELQAPESSSSTINPDSYDLRVYNPSTYDSVYGYGQPPISVVRKGTITSLIIEVNINYGQSSEFDLVISEIEAPEHAERNDAKTASLGENSGNLIAQSLDYWFVLEDVDPDKFYSFNVEADGTYNYFDIELEDKYGSYVESESFQNTIIASGEDTYYIRVRSYDTEAGPFTLTIEETVEPQDIVEVRFNSMLQEGDIFSWEVNVELGGAIANETGEDFPFKDGSVLELEVLNDAPVINIEDGDLYYYEEDIGAGDFKMSVDGEASDFYAFPLLLMILPAEIVLEDGTVLPLTEYATEPQYSGLFSILNMGEAEIVGDEVVMQISEDDVNGQINYETRYDSFVGHLTYLNIEQNFEDEYIHLEISLLDGPNYTLETPQIFGLPFNSIPFVLALLAIPVIRRKLR